MSDNLRRRWSCAALFSLVHTGVLASGYQHIDLHNDVLGLPSSICLHQGLLQRLQRILQALILTRITACWSVGLAVAQEGFQVVLIQVKFDVHVQSFSVSGMIAVRPNHDTVRWCIRSEISVGC